MRIFSGILGFWELGIGNSPGWARVGRAVPASRKGGVSRPRLAREGRAPSRPKVGRVVLGSPGRVALRRDPRWGRPSSARPEGSPHPEALRQWFSNDQPFAPAVLPCAPCRAPTVSKCSAQGKALRKDARGTGMAEERIARSPHLSQAFGGGLNGLAARSTRRRSTTGSLPVGGDLCEALGQWQTKCSALGARTGHARQNCLHTVHFQNKGFTLKSSVESLTQR